MSRKKFTKVWETVSTELVVAPSYTQNVKDSRTVWNDISEGASHITWKNFSLFLARIIDANAYPSESALMSADSSSGGPGGNLVSALDSVPTTAALQQELADENLPANTDTLLYYCALGNLYMVQYLVDTKGVDASVRTRLFIE
tara:strand:- start:1238 stop:1669 length:432 start_codon:yes stop_codon:yes gene_type:complete